ncbi:hypothetical protein [Deinococcus sp. QL22]|uniref:hypothetical protein n=1 Tax=Deinococcus sp. QL22 TaxID=2939437 RepID=UPI0020181B6C|nr:hypothetical protein [Deinococcus sp. QL22]UQN06404.1 hypothetical protein M1R55_00320 [Deinococcus sp. QL22]
MKTPILSRTLLAALTLGTASAVTPVSAPTWSNTGLSSATYVILEPRVEGNINLVGADQRKSILEAMKRDSAGAISRRYPAAKIATDAATPGAIRVTPTFIAPRSLVPWAKLGGRLDFELPNGQKMSAREDFGISILLQKRSEFVNYMYDTVAKQLP